MGEQFLTFDDVLIVPAYSDIESRQEINTDVDFLGTKLSVPIISANMDYVTGPEMANKMFELGALGILHRFWKDHEDYLDAISGLAPETPIWLSVGIKDVEATYYWIRDIVDWMPQTKGICIDVAHGHHKKVADLIELIKGSTDERIAGLKVIAGNVATLDGCNFLYESGADAIKVGIGAGSVCTTRTVAGVGIPQWSAILECASIKTEHPEVTIIADGGIRSSGDIAKAIGAGADVVMVGNLLAGTDETPGEIETELGDSVLQRKKYKRYRGQASFGSNGERYVREGIEGAVPYKGPVAAVVADIQAGLRSAMSYVGARNLAEFRENTRFVEVSSHTLIENSTRVREW